MFSLLSLPPTRIALARRENALGGREPRSRRRIPRSLAHERLGAAALGLRRIAPARPRRVVRQSALVACHRVSGAARPSGDERSSATTTAVPIRCRARPRPRWQRDRRVRRSQRDLTLEADVVIVGTGAGGGIAAETLCDAGPARDPGRGRTAAHLARLPHERGRGLPGPLPGFGGAQDARQGDQHSPGTMRRRQHDGQLDELVPHAAGDARVLGGRAAASTDSRWTSSRRGSRAWRRGCRSRRGTMAPNANNDALARGAAALGDTGRSDPAQRQGLREPRLLRHGLPARRQAVDAGDHDPRGARPRRDARHPRAGAGIRARWRPRHGADLRGDGRAGHASRRRGGSRSARERSSPPPARSARRRCCCAAAFPTRTPSSASARSCIRRWCPRR